MGNKVYMNDALIRLLDRVNHSQEISEEEAHDLFDSAVLHELADGIAHAPESNAIFGPGTVSSNSVEDNARIDSGHLMATMGVYSGSGVGAFGYIGHGRGHRATRWIIGWPEGSREAALAVAQSQGWDKGGGNSPPLETKASAVDGAGFIKSGAELAKQIQPMVSARIIKRIKGGL